MIAGLFALALLQTGIDQGTLVIRQDSVDVAHEGFRLTAGRLTAGNAGWSLTATDLGAESATVNQNALTLGHVTVTGGVNGVVHLWLDAAGHLQRIEIPSRHVVVERLP